MKANYMSFIVVFILLILASFIIAQNESITNMTIIEQINETLTNQTNMTGMMPPEIETNVSAPQLNIAKENEACIERFECLLTPDDQYYFDCYYDINRSECKCYTGYLARCRVSDNLCSVQYECKAAPQSDYYFDCYYDKSKNNCKCFIGAFARCRMEKSSVKIRPPEIEENITTNITETPQIAELPLNQTGLPERKFLTKNVILGAIGGIVIVIIIIILIIIFAMRLKDTPENDLRRARNFHRKAEQFHLKGKEVSAAHYYKLADKYRRRALRKR